MEIYQHTLLLKMIISFEVYVCNSINASFNFSNSDVVRVIPFPIFVWSSDQSRISYFGSRPFQLTRFNSFFHPLFPSERTATVSITSKLNFKISNSTFLLHLFFIYVAL